MKNAFVAVLFLAAFGAVSSVGYGAVLAYNFGNPNASPPPLQAVGGSSYAVTNTGITLTAYGFDANYNPKLLEWKAQGGDENGLGFTDTLDNEITLSSHNQPANYIQVDVTQALAAGGLNGEIKVGSVTDGEAFDVWGSNTLGVLGTNIISANTTDNAFITLPFWGLYDYIAVTVHPELVPDGGGSSYTNNVLLGGVEFTKSNVPEPATMSLLALGGLATLLRRKK